ncbi:MAG: phosphonate ABC transporter, permease protein PhnE, partial [Pseudomonadota bacterium]
MTNAELTLAKSQADTLFGRKRQIARAVPAIILAYFVYIVFAFDIAGLAQRAKLENAVILASDSW